MRDDIEYENAGGLRRWRLQAQRKWIELLDSNALLRQLIHEPLFLGALLLLVVCAGSVFLLVPKVWNPAPKDFSKTVRISLLDYLQAWNLRRTARKAGREERWEEGLIAWRSAIGNNIADPESYRGALRLLRDAPAVHSANLGLVVYARDALLELGKTNRADSLLVAEVLDRHRYPELALETMRPWERELNPAEEAIWLRALLTAGRTAEFLARWELGRERFEKDPLLPLYRASIDATGPPAKAVEALEQLRAGVDSPNYRLEAARLLCRAASLRDEVGDYERGLAVLRKLDAAMVQDETGWWLLLARHDRREEAVAAARAYDKVPPPTSYEVVHLVRTWVELGLEDLALAMLREHAERYRIDFGVWSIYFDLLIQKREWGELRRMAALVRSHAASRDEVLALSWFADALAELAEDRTTSAREYLRRMLEAQLPAPVMTLRMAASLMRLREFETSRQLLQRIEDPLAAAPEYWLQVMANAQGRRDLEELGRAAERLLALRPDHAAGLSVKLGLMLLRRDQPSEALGLSLRLLNAGMNSTAAWINHASALLQNRRTAEARTFLARLNPERLSAVERAAWQMAQAEALFQDGHFQEAATAGSEVDSSQLMPPDAEALRALIANSRRRAEPQPR